MNKTEGEPGHSRMFTNTNNMIKISQKKIGRINKGSGSFVNLNHHPGPEYGEVERAGLFSIVPLTGYAHLWAEEAGSMAVASSVQAFPSFHRERY